MLLKMNLFSILLFCYLQSVASMYCYWNTGCPYRFFSSQTPYNMLRGDIRDSLVKLTDCEPVSIWGLMKHGKKNPDATYGRQMKEAMFIKDYVVSSYENGNSSLCAQDVENLRNWVTDKEIFDKASQLTDEGYQELVGIGRRLKHAFPQLLKELGKDDYTFRSVKEKSAVDSMKGLVDGLGNKQLNLDPPKDGYDNIIPYSTCNKYLNDFRHNNATYEEAEKYLMNSEFLASKDRLQRRLGIDSNSLTNTNIIAIWDLCRYTSNGIHNKFSPWCALFTTEDLKVMEYVEDLDHYYRNGYGVSMNKLFGEIVLSDVLKSFRDAKEGTGKKIQTYITNNSMMDMAYIALGLFKDDTPLTGQQRKPDRKWRTSKFSIFANNLFVVLNKCGKGNDFNVVFYLNEEPLRTICKEGVCTWKEFEDKVAPFLETNTEFCDK